MKMKFKRMLSMFMAVAMLMTMFTVASAAETTSTLWEGEFELVSGWGANLTDIKGTAFQGWSGDVTLTVSMTVNDASAAQVQLKNIDSSWNWNDLSEVFTFTTETSFTYDIDADTLEEIKNGNGLVIGGQNVTITKVELTGDYEEVLFDAWVGNSFTSSASQSFWNAAGTTYVDFADYTSADYADIESVTVDFTSTGYAQLTIGTNDAVDGWVSSYVANEGGANSLTLEFANGVEAGVDLNVQIGWINEGVTLEITGVSVEVAGATTTLEPNVIYVQETEAVGGVKSVRFVQMISEELAAETESVTYTISNGSAEAVATSAACYSAVKAAGAEITADDGYVFVAYAVTGVPADVDLTCAMTLN